MIQFSYSSSKEHVEKYDIADKAFEKYSNVLNSDNIGFFRIPNNNDYITSCERVFENFQDRKTFVQIGIGGSSLGPEMLITSLASSEREFIFINNIDPDQIHHQLKNVDVKNTLFYVVSKSGGTAETIAGTSIAMKLLGDNGVSQAEFKNYFVFATDPVKSQLLDLSKTLNIQTLDVPSNVGGRFSVLTPVGLLPAIFAGLDIKELFKGACDFQAKMTNKNDNPVVEMANYLWGEYQGGKNQTVIMPYSSRLRDLAFWYVQLWAESLGKEFNQENEKVETGLTPIPGYGATDQHSQMQLFMEGPRDKVLMLIEVEKFQNDFDLASNIDLPSFQKLENFTLSQLMKAELEGTKKALIEKNRPYALLKLPELNEYYLGQTILYFEALTALMGEYFEINAFDQPGVELGKVYAYEYLSNI